MYDYNITIQIPFQAGDDPDARKMAQEMIKDIRVPDNSTIKLQRLEKDKAPVGIQIV